MSTPPPLGDPTPMNTPPPFGDPSAIDRENAASVRKGFAIGCGGCLALVMLGLALVAGVLLMIFSFLRNQEPCSRSLKAAQASEVMRRELGEPMRMGWMMSGNVSMVNDEGSASVTVPIEGPLGSASVHTEGTRAGGVWTFQQMEATIEKSGAKVDLLEDAK
jgi:hypothetical protein